MHLLARRTCFPITTHWVVPVRRTTLHRTGSLSNRSDLRHMLACAFQIDDFHALTMISDDEMFELPLLQWHLVSGFFSCWSKSDAAREDLEWIAMCSSYGLLLALINSGPLLISRRIQKYSENLAPHLQCWFTKFTQNISNDITKTTTCIFRFQLDMRKRYCMIDIVSCDEDAHDRFSFHSPWRGVNKNEKQKKT